LIYHLGARIGETLLDFVHLEQPHLDPSDVIRRIHSISPSQYDINEDFLYIN